MQDGKGKALPGRLQWSGCLKLVVDEVTVPHCWCHLVVTLSFPAILECPSLALSFIVTTASTPCQTTRCAGSHNTTKTWSDELNSRYTANVCTSHVYNGKYFVGLWILIFIIRRLEGHDPSKRVLAAANTDLVGWWVVAGGEDYLILWGGRRWGGL